MRLPVLAAVKFSGNGALISSSRVTLFCAHARGTKHTIASTSKTHFFIFISERCCPERNRKVFRARLICRATRNETLNRNLQHITWFWRTETGSIVNQSLQGQIGILHKAQRTSQQSLRGTIKAQPGKDDAAITHHESTSSRGPARRPFVRRTISHACVYIPTPKFDVSEFELALAS